MDAAKADIAQVEEFVVMDLKAVNAVSLGITEKLKNENIQ